jgi:hypothetical protein
MEIFLIIGKYVFRWYLVMCVVNMLIFRNHLKQYHVIYKTLKGRKYYIDTEREVILSTPLFTDDMLIWRYKTDSFGLKNGVYLYSSPAHYFNSPYSLYWLWKYKKWFREHIDLTQIQEIY